MKKVYESTLDEVTDAQLRAGELTGGGQFAKLAVIVFAFLAFTTLGLAAALLMPRHRAFPIIVSVMGYLLWLSYILANYKKLVRRRAKHTLAKIYQPELLRDTEYELQEDGVVFRRSHQALWFGWPSVTTYSEADDCLELVMHPLAIVRIPKRIFDDKDELQQWSEFIESKTGLGASMPHLADDTDPKGPPPH